MPCHLVIPAADLSRVGEARRAAAVLAKGAGFGASQQGEIAIIATELTTNLAKHATNGRLLLQAIPPSGAQASASMELIAVDTGPGMSDPERCLRDGYSTGGTAGTGLGAIQAAARAFMASLTPKGREGDFFGFFSLCGKSAAVLGPLIFGQVSHATGGNQRLAILTVMILFILGGVLLTRVQAGGPSIERRT